MNTLSSLLAELDGRGIVLVPQDGRLEVRAPRGSLTPELRAALLNWKPALLEHLQAPPPAPGLATTLAGKRLFVTGATGFLGKAFVGKLVGIAPGVGRVACLARGRGRGAAARVDEEIVRTPVLGSLRRVLEGRLAGVDGELGVPRFGLDERGWEALAGDIDVVVHIAGVVDLSPPLRQVYATNIEGTRQAIALARAAGVPLLHVSTCYVAGPRGGRIPEALAIGDHPRRSEGVEGFSAEREAATLRRFLEEAAEEADDPAARAAAFDPARGATSAPALAERARERARERAEERGRAWGFANLYTYSKAIAEQLVADAVATGLRATVVRPAILESAWSFPERGWNQSVNTSAPLAWLAREGHVYVPAREGATVDILPVDMAAGAMVAILAALVEGRADPVYQLGTSDTNAAPVRRLVELTSLHYRDRHWVREAVVVPPAVYERWSSPAFERLASTAASLLADARIEAPTLDVLRARNRQVVELFEAYQLIFDAPNIVFDTTNTRALRDALLPSDREQIGFEPETLDWREYWVGRHLPGLERWCFPELDRLAATPPPRPAEKRGRAPDDDAPLPPADVLLARAAARDPRRPLLGDRTAAELQDLLGSSPDPAIRGLTRADPDASRIGARLARALSLTPGDELRCGIPLGAGLGAAVLRAALNHGARVVAAGDTDADPTVVVGTPREVDALAAEVRRAFGPAEGPLLDGVLGLSARLAERAGIDPGATGLGKRPGRVRAVLCDGPVVPASVHVLRGVGVRVHAWPDDVDGTALPPLPPPPPLPAPVQRWGRAAVDTVSARLHEMLDVEVSGREHIPWDTNAIVAANHASHLDLGVLKRALDGYVDEALVAGARDYFFGSPLAQALSENFTRLVPVDRERTSRTQLGSLAQRLREGHTLVVFPEGTRSTTGETAPFRPGIGLLATEARAGILPVHIRGTHDVLPKGAFAPRGIFGRRPRVRVRIGRFLDARELAEQCAGLSRKDAARRITQVVEDAVRALGAS